ncbi:RAMP superfamily CRISPR-associated protein [Sulfolobus acidocaldarius]|uniref:Conserved protein n=3 Tax=Sulfolobus acidocaldarius TaxID=2285 RepID=Q4J792_SULAC|nr:RAMP superfamily CRISPR-associated protein [Sulfolobus acidocaldarius]AAY81340.1 conserved protein [Sulfolobus acidocaldarius DSM 639]AGE74254.1 hypothetical protein SacRon12I_10180 [Sulfolobus acidocaldarius Ron12/I]ALU29860.1 hypothetical protein ATY89_07855 [Sulfolobus acidocaldarius]ALU32600.1 hypothetical protein ATZ20_10875 [Sulfolobus acidocaldarius]WCM35842.1 hypothetical protein GO597_11135 [Sulfolobus acidocaldarius DSM 639]
MKLQLIKLVVNKYITTQMRKVKNYYFSTTDYIPATTLRGAILAEYYYQKGKIEEDFYVSPAYPQNSAPSHYFSPAEGRKGSEFVEESRILSIKNDEINKGKDMREVMNLGIDKKPRIGVIIKPNEKQKSPNETRYIKYTPSSTILMHVAIDKVSASSFHRMLYAYEYLKFNEMWALAKPGDVIDTVEQIRIGRSRSRIDSIVKVQKVKEVNLEEPDGLTYCLSPCVPSLLGEKLFEIRKLSSGKTLVIGEESYYTGWFTTDTHSGAKPVFKTMKEGSLVYVEHKGDYSKLMPAGLNFMVKIEDLASLLSKVSL